MKVILVLITTVIATHAFAAAAVSYSCVGRNLTDRESVVFDIQFSDSAPDVGYTNESITITKKSGIPLDKPMIFQMFGATKFNYCKATNAGEIYLKIKLNMTQIKNEALSGYSVTIKADCGAPAEKLNITGICLVD